MTRPPRLLARLSATTRIGMLALLVVPLVLAPRAEAFVYWTSLNTGMIGRANLDGTGVDNSFIKAPVGSGLAVDPSNIYWSFWRTNAQPYDGKIGRANLDGSRVQKGFIRGAGRPMGLAVNATHVYWANASHTTQDPYGDTIWRAALDGSPPFESFSIGPSDLTGWLAVTATHVYWVDTYGGGWAIDRARLDGTGVERGFISGSSFYPSGIAVDADHIYWASTQGRTIGRANLDGTGVEHDFITDAGLPGVVAVDAGHVYWTNGGARIGRANLDGSNVEQGYVDAAANGQFANVASLAVSFSLGGVKKVDSQGTAKLKLEVPAPGGIALAQTKKVKGTEVRADAAGEVQLSIQPHGRAKKKLAEKGKAKVKTEVTYTPDGGEPETQTATLKLTERG